MYESISEKILRLVEDGLIDKDALILSCVKYLNSEQLKEMCELNGINLEDNYNNE